MSAQPDDPLALREGVDVPDDPAEAFGELLERNEHVCKNCYRILGRQERVPNPAGDRYHEILAAVEFELPDDHQFDLLDREYSEDVPLDSRREQAAPPAGSPTSGGERGCWNCGVIETHRTPSGTRSKKKALELVPGISTTLSEYGIEHEESVLAENIRKAWEEDGGDEYEQFRSAVAATIEAARGSR